MSNLKATLKPRGSPGEGLGRIPAQRLDQRQRKVKDDDGPFKGMVTIQSLAEDAGLPLDRVLRQAGGD